ncbi:MAG: hypothetical protein RLZZ161_471 [Bacteroidota bacterium]|jgi:hypothetical protein
MGLPLQTFETLNLQVLNLRTDWEKRNDSKFLAHVSALDAVLQSLSEEYLLLENQGSRVWHYTTEYWDTPDRNMFYEHHRDRAHRYKIRRRRYGQEDGFWLEVKEKTPDGRTLKHRLFNPAPAESEKFILTNSPYISSELSPALSVDYDRLTFLHKTQPLKITVDTNLKANNGSTSVSFTDLMILEIKSEKIQGASAAGLLKSFGLKPCSVSKYCIGMATLHPELKQNAFKPLLMQIKKISTYGNS